jgi:YegS/Rv2252/BmrU family lipid kinase
LFDPNKSVVIVNPAAGGGLVARRWETYLHKLRSAIGEAQILKTEKAGDGIDLARQAVEDDVTTVFSFGGDGTHNEVLNGILTAKTQHHVTMGILHAGTGGDFRKMLVGGGRLQSTLDRLPSAEAKPIDAIQVDYHTDDGQPARRFCLNIAQAGLAGVVDRHVNASSKRLGGTATFLIATLRAVARYKPSALTVTIDGETQEVKPLTNIVIANGRYAGGGMLLAPNAQLADHAMDVLLIQHAPLLKTLRLTPKIYSGTHIETDLVESFRASRIEVSFDGDEPIYLDIDGESPGKLPATFTLLPNAISLLDPNPSFL